MPVLQLGIDTKYGKIRKELAQPVKQGNWKHKERRTLAISRIATISAQKVEKFTQGTSLLLPMCYTINKKDYQTAFDR